MESIGLVPVALADPGAEPHGFAARLIRRLAVAVIRAGAIRELAVCIGRDPTPIAARILRGAPGISFVTEARPRDGRAGWGPARIEVAKLDEVADAAIELDDRAP